MHSAWVVVSHVAEQKDLLSKRKKEIASGIKMEHLNMISHTSVGLILISQVMMAAHQLRTWNKLKVLEVPSTS